MSAQSCPRCGQFMRHIWFQTSDEPDSWEDYWRCPQHAKHLAAIRQPIVSSTERKES